MAQGVFGAHSFHPHAIHDVTCLSVCCLFVLSLSCFSLTSTFPLSQSTCSLSGASTSTMSSPPRVKSTALTHDEEYYPWRYTILSQRKKPRGHSEFNSCFNVWQKGKCVEQWDYLWTATCWYRWTASCKAMFAFVIEGMPVTTQKSERVGLVALVSKTSIVQYIFRGLMVASGLGRAELTLLALLLSSVASMKIGCLRRSLRKWIRTFMNVLNTDIEEQVARRPAELNVFGETSWKTIFALTDEVLPLKWRSGKWLRLWTMQTNGTLV